MKVLVVSHNVFSKTSNMGKTLLSYFNAFQPEEIAQFYIHSEVPTDKSVCTNYYRFTDIDAVKSIVNRNIRGNVFTEEDIVENDYTAAQDIGKVRNVYKYKNISGGSKFLLRNTAWKLSNWFNADLKKWTDDFKPDVIFLASGNYSFIYDIALKLSEYTGAKLVISCVDDYYCQNLDDEYILGRLLHKNFMKHVRKAFARASCAFTICDLMAKKYEEMFGIQCHILYTGALNAAVKYSDDRKQISYMGNLSLGRGEQLVDMGRALVALNRSEEPKAIDVYGSEPELALKKLFTEENGIRFHGRIPFEEVMQVMGKSMAVIHTESFDKKIQERVRYSVSTKIAESLMYGPCLISYGPNEVASIDYLKRHNSAFVIDSKEQLRDKLQKFINNKDIRDEIIMNARETAFRNHDIDKNGQLVKKWLQDCLK